jgi:alkylated DNA repair dioxygenase AlkB
MSFAPVEVVPGIVLYPAFLGDAETLLHELYAELAVRQEYLNFGHGPVPMPRLTAWYGDPGAVYRYSRLNNTPVPWTQTLAALRDELEARLHTTLNSCLVNLYRNGEHSMGWHADDELELRDLIVSVSLGATRRFLLRPGGRGKSLAVDLAAGSILTMTVESQRYWQHAVPKVAASGLRLNLTFRNVVVQPPAR